MGRKEHILAVTRHDTTDQLSCLRRTTYCTDKTWHWMH